MNKQEKQIAFRRAARIVAVAARTVLLSVLALIGNLGMAGKVAFAAQTSAQYCNQYTTNGKVNACKDGIRGQDCSDYAITFDEETANVCRKAAQAKQGGQISDLPAVNTSESSSSTNSCSDYNGTLQQACQMGASTGNCNSNLSVTNPQAYQACQAGVAANADSFNGSKVGSITAPPSSVQDLLNQSQTLSKYIDVLHGAGPNAGTDTTKEADNNYASYVNGSGKQQPIKVTPCAKNAGSAAAAQSTSSTQSVIRDATGKKVGSISSTTTTGGCPAIIFLNGGGWHGDDGTSQCVAAGAAGVHSSCTDGGGGGNTTGDDANNGPPAGGGATARGYTVIEVTYRLGSSGIYYMYEDVMRGIQHVINNAGMYGIDTGKIALMGDSAGGSLAMRAAASGKSGAKVAVGWSAPTNAYTGLFKSFKSFAIGMDHSTCIPTDLAGLTNFTDLLNGGSGQVAQYGQGISSNDFSGLGLSQGQSGLPSGVQSPVSNVGDAVTTLTQVLTAAQYASKTSQNVEAISQQMQSSSGGSGSSPLSLGSLSGGSGSGLSGGIINLSSKKLIECIDNFNVMSPALFASPETPPSFLAGFSTDDVVDQQQAYDMRDKLRSLGIEADALILDGDPNGTKNALGPNEGNHLGYDARFVCPTINFIDHIVQPEKDSDKIDCATGKRPSQSAPTTNNAGSGGSGSSSNNGGSKAGSGDDGCGPTAHRNSSGGCTPGPGSQVSCPGDNVPACRGNTQPISPTNNPLLGGSNCPAGYTCKEGPVGDNAWQSALAPQGPTRPTTQSFDSFYNQVPQSGTTAPYTPVAPAMPSPDGFTTMDTGGR